MDYKSKQTRFVFYKAERFPLRGRLQFANRPDGNAGHPKAAKLSRRKRFTSAPAGRTESS